MIALVVTIIVLLILAAVAINLTIGENGIFTRAQDAVKDYKRSEAVEDLEFYLASEKLDKILEEITPPNVEDANPGKMEGEGTEENPYQINSIEDLVYFSKSVNEGESYSEKFIVLANSLDFKSENSYVDINTTTFGDINQDNIVQGIKDEVTTAKGFTPIGNVEYIQSGSDDFGTQTQAIGNGFKGTFWGNDKYIKNIYIKSNDINGIGMGLFGWNNGLISNLTVTGEILDDMNSTIGGITAFNDGEIRNCQTAINIVSNERSYWWNNWTSCWKN